LAGYSISSRRRSPSRSRSHNNQGLAIKQRGYARSLENLNTEIFEFGYGEFVEAAFDRQGNIAKTLSDRVADEGLGLFRLIGATRVCGISGNFVITALT
jgi:hypothetical protein